MPPIPTPCRWPSFWRPCLPRLLAAIPLHCQRVRATLPLSWLDFQTATPGSSILVQVSPTDWLPRSAAAVSSSIVLLTQTRPISLLTCPFHLSPLPARVSL